MQHSIIGLILSAALEFLTYENRNDFQHKDHNSSLNLIILFIEPCKSDKNLNHSQFFL